MAGQQAAGQAFCHLCGQSIRGQGRLFRHPDWPAGRTLRVCETCQRSRPRCRLCALPLAAASDQPGPGLCATCSRKQESACRACGAPVNGAGYAFNGQGPYCERCVRQRPACSICGAPLTDERWQLSDGRVSCAICHVSAVYSPEEAGRLYETMKTLVETGLDLHLNVPTGLALVDLNQLAEIIHRQAPPGAEAVEMLSPEHTLGLYARQGMRRGIYVQSGLPCPVFLQVAAHEYAHAWQGENCPLLRDRLVQEGFAEWVAYRVLGHYHDSCGLAVDQGEFESHARAQMLQRNDVYGQGLRWALDLEARAGVAGLLEACRRPA